MAINSTIFLDETEIRADEDSGSVTERIVRNGSLEDAVTITYGVSGNTAVAGDDFVGGFGTVTMPSGASEATVQVQLLDDSAEEDTEVFVFSLVNVEGGTLWAPRTSRVSILDDERPPPPPPSEPPLVSDYSVAEVPVLSGLDQPIKFEFSPVDPSRVYVAEKPGAVRLADLDTGAATTVLDIRDRVNDHNDRGLLDIALHPDFAGTPYIYAFVVVDPPETADRSGNAGPDGFGNRYAQVLRFTADPATGYSTAVPGSETVLLGRAGRSLDDLSGGGADDFTDPAFADADSSERYINPDAPAQTVVDGFKQDFIKVDSLSHAGGALTFGPDGALYVAVGDGTSPNYADPHSLEVQSLDSLSGKMLRVDPLTGLGFRDNPFADPEVPLDANRAKVWQYGLRNPFSTAFDAEERLFISNTGWDSWEMINLGGPGANFGWPYFEGGDGGELLRAPGYQNFGSAQDFYDAVESGDIKVTAPFRAFSHDSTDPGFQVQGITGGSVIYTGARYPDEFRGDYFFADFAGGEVYTVDANDRTELKFLYGGEESRVPLEFVQGPDDYVYYVNLLEGEIGRLEIGGAEPTPGGPATTTIGSGPDTLVLRVTQDFYAGNALYTVSVDGVRIGGTLTAQALRGSGEADTVSVLGDFSPGAHTVTIDFLNDDWGGTPSTDRNLYLESAAYNGATVAGASAELLSGGPQSFGFTDTGATTPSPGSGGATTTVGAGPDTLVLRITQDAYEGSAQFTVSVDGTQIGGALTAQALRESGEADTVNVLGDFAAGGHTVTVNFLNDAYGGTATTDRNLYVESAAYNGAAVSGAARTLLSDGPSSFAFTDTGAATPPPGPGGATSTVGTGPDTLVLRVTQDAYQGSAQYTVSVDGVQIGGTLTAQALQGSGEADTVNILGDFAAGGHIVTVNFINDAYGGTPSTDRNLYVESADYNGAAVSGAARTLLSTGPSSFGFTDTGAATPPPGSGGGSTTTSVGTGPDTLALRVSQDAYEGSAQYTVGVDGTQIGDVQTATALRGSGLSDTVNVLGDFTAGGHTATVDFLNDAYGGTAGTDRNLYVDGATYNGAAVAGAARTLLSGGPSSFGFTDSGTSPPSSGGGGTTTIGSGSDTLVLRIAQDAYQGSAQYTVSVDGAQIGGVQTATALRGGEADTVTVLGSFAPGGHTVTVTFLNDAYDGTPATDRNLYIEGATYNGSAVSGASAALLSEGPRSFGVTDSSPIA